MSSAESSLLLFCIARWPVFWIDHFVFTFRLGEVSRFCSTEQLVWRPGIYTEQEVVSPHFISYLDSCILSPHQQYNQLQVQTHNRGIYVSRSAKESSFRYHIFRMIYRLIASTTYHHEECKKVPSGDHFLMQCLIRLEVCLNLPYTLDLYLSTSVIGSMEKSWICGGYWVTNLAHSYVIDTSKIVQCPIRELGVTDLGKILKAV